MSLLWVSKMINVGISQCLLGANVRYDGGHRNNRFCTEVLARLFNFTALCPEVGIGLPVPRKTIRLVGDITSPKAVLSNDTSQDFTHELSQFADTHSAVIAQLSGYILCKASPSCGMERVKVYNQHGQSQKRGIGIFAARLKQLFPLLPIEEDGRLNDPLLRDSFIKRVYVYHEWQDLTTKQHLTVNQLLKFHARHKMSLLAHNPSIYRQLGPLAASATSQNIHQVANEYIQLLLTGLQSTATRSNTTNVLMHLQGHLKKRLNRGDKAELNQCILDYNKGLQPLLAPITLLKHHFKNNPKKYIQRLSFFDPYPKQLAIRVSIK